MPNKRYSYVIIAVLILLLLSTGNASANSALPPSLTVMVINPPDDLQISLQVAGVEDGTEQAVVQNQAWESYYNFYPISLQGFEPISISGATLIVTSSEKAFEVSLPTDLEEDQYSRLVTLDFDAETLIAGAPAWREPVLITSRVLLTLVLEGLVFYLFGYRQKRSWIVFLVINLLTQTTLNILISNPGGGGYVFLGFLFLEILIFIVEAIAFPLTLKEGSSWKAFGYSLLANLVSLVVGGAVLAYLPV